MLTAITRKVSPSLAACELTFLPRQPIDIPKATAQHKAYERCLAQLGVRVISLPVERELPDAVFIEDTAVVVDEMAIMTEPGSASRQPEVESVARTLSTLRPLKYLRDKRTLDGGDVMRVGHTLYVGESKRTSLDGIAQLQVLLQPYDYKVETVPVMGCLHLKTGCSYLGRDTVLVNRSWVGTKPFDDLDLIDVPEDEPWAANSLTIDGITLLPDCYPNTKGMLEERGFNIRTLDISELQKAEGGLTCLSIIFDNSRQNEVASALTL